MQRIISLMKTFTFGSIASRTTTVLPKLQDTTSMLRPYVPVYDQICGMKVKGKVRRRCKACYIVVRQERMYVMCPKLGRHKQMSMKPKPHNTWTLTHATQSPVRPW